MNGPPTPPDVIGYPSRPSGGFSGQMTAMLHRHLHNIQAAKPCTSPKPFPAATGWAAGGSPAPAQTPTQHSSQAAWRQQQQPAASPDHLRGRGRVLAYHSSTAHSAPAHAPSSASSPPSPASARSSRSNLPELALGHRPIARSPSVGSPSRQCPVSRMHGHLPPTTPAMELLERTAVALRARSSMATPPTCVHGGLPHNGSCSSMTTGVYVDAGGAHGEGSSARLITGKRGITHLPLLMPASPKGKRRRIGYRPYSVHAPRYRQPAMRKTQNSNMLRKQLMRKGRRC